MIREGLWEPKGSVHTTLCSCSHQAAVQVRAWAPTRYTLDHTSFHNTLASQTDYIQRTSTRAQGTDPRVALGAQGELPWIYLGAWGGGN